MCRFAERTVTLSQVSRRPEKNIYYYYCLALQLNVFILEYQKVGIINTLPEPMAQEIFQVARKFNPAMEIEDQMLLKNEVQEKLHWKEIIKN